MIVFQICITVLYATIVLALFAMAAALYYLIFATIMIAWDGCELCQRMRQG